MFASTNNKLLYDYLLITPEKKNCTDFVSLSYID